MVDASHETGTPLDPVYSSRHTTARARWLASGTAVVLGLSIPISVALDNILLVVLLLTWLASGQWLEKYHLVRRNPVALSALALLAWLALGLSWGSGPLADGLVYFRKYSNLLLIPILISLSPEQRYRRYALLAFAGGVAITLILSYALALGLLPTGGFITGEPSNPTVFKKHITQNILTAFGAFVFAELALEAAQTAVRWAWGLLSVAAAFNVLFLVQGRTGYVVLAVLTVLFLFRTLRWRGILAAAALMAAAAAAGYQFSASFHQRVSLALAGADKWHPGVATASDAVGQRLEFYTNTVAIVREHPLFGVGTAGFVPAYAARVEGTAMEPTRNPHNQYLLTASQVGLVGLALLLLLLVQQWRCANRLSSVQDRTLAHGLVLTMTVGSLFNSLLIDHTESMLFGWMAGLLYAAYMPTRPTPQSP